MKLHFRFMLGQLFTEDGTFAILRRFGNGFIAARFPLGGDTKDSIFRSPEIIKPRGDYGIYVLPEPKLIRFYTV